MDIKKYSVNHEDGTIEIVVNLKLENYLLMLYKIGAISSDELGELAVEYL